MNAQANEVARIDPSAELTQFFLKREKAFKTVLGDSADIQFERECLFAKQHLMKSDFAIGTAQRNQQSLHNAIMNVAAIRLTLNPASAYAYLVPRDGAIMLDISYRGLCKLATDTGIIKWVQAEMVYEGEIFKLQGLNAPPQHDRDPFGEKGAFRGVYCVAKTNDGDYLTNVMSAADIYKIRDLSQAYKFAESKGKNNSVWHTWFDQMALKTVVKRASKMWPVSDGSERLHLAVNLLNEQDGSAPIPAPAPRLPAYTPDTKELFDQAINKPDSAQLWHLSRSLPDGVWLDLHSSYLDTAQRGKKGEYRNRIDTLTNEGRDDFVSAATQLQALKNADDDMGAMQIIEEFSGQMSTLQEQLSVDVSEWVDSLEG